MRKKFWKRLGLGCLLGCLLIVMAMWLYIRDYEHATDLAMQCAAEARMQAEQIVFEPDGDVKAGIVFYPGGKVQYEAYAPLMQELAEEGFLCVLLHVPGNLAFFDINAADGVVNAFSQVDEWYLAGHSLGGVAASDYLDSHRDDFEGIILLASYLEKDLSDSEERVLAIYGSEDQVLTKKFYEKAKQKLPDDFEEYVIEGGNHSYFGSYGVQKGDGTATIEPEQQWDKTSQIISDWIRRAS